MASATLPPWLDASPQLYLGAATAGLREGVQVGEAKERYSEFEQNLGFQQQKMAQDAALTAQEMQMKQLNMKLQLASFMQNLKQQGLENQLKIDKQQSDKNIAEQSLAVDKHYKEQMMDYHNTQAKTAQDRFQMQADQAARKFQAQQEALRRINNGEDPTKVYADLWAAIGGSASGIGSVLKDLQPKTEAAPDTGPEIVERDGQRFLKHTDRFGTVNYSELRQQPGGADDKYIGHLINIIKTLQTGNYRATLPGTPENQKLMHYQDLLDQALAGGRAGVGAAQQPGAGEFGMRSIVNVKQPAPREFTEAGDQEVGISPSHDEEGQTEAPAPEQPAMMPGALNYQKYIALPQ